MHLSTSANESAADDVQGAAVDGQSRRKSDLTGRAQQLLGYLEGLYRLRHPDSLDAIPNDMILSAGLPDHEGVRLRPDDDVLLEVDRVDLPDRPPMPDLIASRADWPDIQRSPRLRPLLEADSEADLVVGAFDAWIREIWSPWRDQIQPILAARELFLTLYDMRLVAERDLATHEAVWVHGVAVGQSIQGERCRLPLFVYPVRYEIDDRSGTIRVRATGPARFEIDPFERSIDTFDLVKRLKTELTGDTQETSPAEAEAEPEYGTESVNGLTQAEVLERLANVIVDAEYLPSAAVIPSVCSNWQIAGVDGLFHRRRSVHYEAYFRSLSETIEGGYLPDTWSAILADEPTKAPLSKRIASIDEPWTSLDQRILSPLPLNEQQRAILTRIAHNAGVTVQGPPGTGKSYAIAALTSHFLACGLRVLICAEKPQPLQVIRDKMPAELRELCVAVLGDDQQSNQQLEASVAAITARVNSVDQDQARTRLEEVEQHLDRVRRKLAELRNRELDIRKAEQETLRIDGTDLGVAEAARQLASSPADGWLPDNVSPGVSLPLAPDELAELVRLTNELSEHDRTSHGPTVFDPDQFPTATQLVDDWRSLETAGLVVASIDDTVDVTAVVATGPDQMRAIVDLVSQHRDRVAWSAAPQFAVIRHALVASAAQRERWHQVFGQLAAEADAVVKLALQLAAHEIAYPAAIDGQDPARLLVELRDRLSAGGSLPRFGASSLKKLLAALSIDGRRPNSAADLDLVEAGMARDQHRQRLVTLWNNECMPLGLDPLESTRPENHFQTVQQPWMQALLELSGHTRTIAEVVGPLLRWSPVFDQVDCLDAVLQQLESAQAEFPRQELQSQIESLSGQVAELARQGHRSTRPLHDALLKRNPDAWEEAAGECRRLRGLASQLNRHAELIERLKTSAPAMANRYRTETPTFDVRQIQSAWRWRQLRHWVDGILGLGSLADISASIADHEGDEQRLLGEVVAERAWLEMSERTTGAQRSALETWAQAMSRVGKGTGKHAPRHRQTARRAMRQAQGAVPVWIMSISRAIDSFRPGHDTAFDIVIVDEASQAPLDAISVLGLGQRVLVVGDDKQISPTIIADETEADRLRRHYLEGVPDADGFDIRTSLYDTASRRFPGVIQLQEHFRCLPEIIAFSNDLAYEGRIDPLRERHRDPDWSPTRVVFVDEGYRDGSVNPPEVDAVVALVAEILECPVLGPGPNYPDGATIGIIAMIGRDQAQAIQSRLMEELSIEEIEARRIRVGSPYEFQGDERDVMIVSMVDALGNDGKITGRAATSKSEHQRYNVAASRARDQLIVVHSFRPVGLAESDLRRKLVAFAQNPVRHSAPVTNLRDACDSRFERDILERLLKLGVRVDGQYPVAGYRLDFTLTDLEGRRVAIECDGDSFHGIEQLRADTNRQRILERLGWRFVRIRASEFYSDPDGSFAALLERARDHGLRPPE